MAPYWAVVRLQPRRETVAARFLVLAGFTVYLPRLREHRVRHGRRIELQPPLFPGYCFAEIELQWHAVRWAPGTNGLIMDGERPAKVPDGVIVGLRSREKGGLIELPKAPRLRPGGPVRVRQGPLEGHLGLYVGQTPQQRVEVLMTLFGARRTVQLPAGALEPLS